MQREATVLPLPTRISAGDDALWYKDAVIYQVHVRSFHDSDGDGMGDFRGLTQKLDYIQDLGVTAIWLLPFFPSPLRDDGYDIADYEDVNPRYGALADFKTFLREAHRRDLRVITELVMNHTSDQHEWFQRSRQAKPGSKWRNFYVWSDSPDRYRETRIIFQDFEASNWTWDPVAHAYFWHRFYHHQPDLNFDNPEVRRAMFKVIDFWMEMGVDGVRLDAVPYLFEREGTNCENLPETHQFLKELRAHVDRRFPGRMLLAEANQWPEDAAAYFGDGDGDECHMNFHFPLMPRLFMAVEREDRFPVIDILDQTPALPETSQWAIFLRNHDELTLEMVTDEERDYMYRAYAADFRARVNLGIRRRLAPLLRNNRRKIELMTGLLLSLPGTPIVYYGDELAMGDNIYLGDRDGVRTPMQWSSDRNSGFSHANPQRLFLPVIIDPEYHYTIRNVEVEQNSPHSILWWMRRIINVRKQYRAFGRGTFEFVKHENPKVLAYLRQYEDETLLFVGNLSRFPQATELDLARFRGETPVELFGQIRFPAIGELPYFVTLGPHSFYWFRIRRVGDDEVEHAPSELPRLRVEKDWDAVFQGRVKSKLESAVGPYLRRHRWFGGKAREIQSVALLDWFPIEAPSAPAPMRLLLVRVDYNEGEPDRYLTPVVFAQGAQAENILGDHPAAGIAHVSVASNGDAVLCEATWEREFWVPLLNCIARRRTLRGQGGEIRGIQTKAFRALDHGAENGHAPAVHGGEQSNTSAVFDNRFVLKLFRRLSPGVNPDLEVGRFLTERAPLASVPGVAGALEYKPVQGEAMTFAVLHEYVTNQGDAWVFTLDELGRYIERVQAAPDMMPLPGDGETPDVASRLVDPRASDNGQPARSSESFAPEDAAQTLRHAKNMTLLELSERDPPDLARELIGYYLESAELLGQRTAEMHLALASRSDDPAFAPEPFTKLYQRSLYQSMRTDARKSLDLLRKRLPNLAEPLGDGARQILEREKEILGRFKQLSDRKISARRIRCHGDLHLGQVLYTGRDFAIIDFEGEPERPIGERRIKSSPLRDVAGMVRSFHYASHAAILREAPGLTGLREASIPAEEWLHFWYIWTTAAYLKSYFAKALSGDFLPADRTDLSTLLDCYLLDKAMYELSYELNNRPQWARIPMEGILHLTPL
jgi:maltose alpha-D-glucosyltransferase/alpha-amylase